MKKKIIIIVGILVLATVSFFIFKNKNQDQDGVQNQTGKNSPKNLKEIFGLGIAQKCTYDGGVVYVANGKMRGDFTSMDEGVAMNGHMIVDGNTSYIWSDGQSIGYKTTFDLNETPTTESGDTSVSNDINPLQPEDYACDAWIANPEVFALPAGVEFKDFSSLIPTMPPNAGDTGSQNNCSYCDMLSGDDKSQCLSAMNCE